MRPSSPHSRGFTNRTAAYSATPSRGAVVRAFYSSARTTDAQQAEFCMRSLRRTGSSRMTNLNLWLAAAHLEQADPAMHVVRGSSRL